MKLTRNSAIRQMMSVAEFVFSYLTNKKSVKALNFCEL